MARYEINYLDGNTDTITANNLEPSGGQYIAWNTDGSAAAYIPAANVRSIIKRHEETSS
ncbi:hypothetical protein ACIQH0_36425 [Streptomyces griseus]|uniref:hypothetical protein n=1 Tax=Streptomyces griseus TaxID=1911 RepID=UPI00380E3B91